MPPRPHTQRAFACLPASARNVLNLTQNSSSLRPSLIHNTPPRTIESHPLLARINTLQTHLCTISSAPINSSPPLPISSHIITANTDGQHRSARVPATSLASRHIDLAPSRAAFDDANPIVPTEHIPRNFFPLLHRPCPPPPLSPQLSPDPRQVPSLRSTAALHHTGQRNGVNG